MYLEEDESSKTLEELITYHSNKIQNTLAPGSIRNFNITENYIKRFLLKKKKTTNIYLKELNYKFLCNFENFLANYWPVGYPRGMSHNTIMKHINDFVK